MTVAPELALALEQSLFFDGDYLFCRAFYQGLKPLLVDAYRRHLGESTTYSDRPTTQLLQEIVAEEERQIAWVEGALAFMADVSAAEKQAGHEAVRQVQAWVSAVGGILDTETGEPAVLPEPRAYAVTRQAKRDPRQIAPFTFESPDGEGEALEQARLTRFTAYFREMAAAETELSGGAEADPDGQY